jgi:FixJ family two-component response regulator
MPEDKAFTVYVVDDEKVIASSLTAILNMSGFRSTAFNSAEAAILSAKSDCPALLITDVVMPEMNGIELAIHFKSSYPDCKVLLFSGQAGTTDLLRTATAQGHDFKLLTKPVHPTDLLAVVRAAIPPEISSGAA